MTGKYDNGAQNPLNRDKAGNHEEMGVHQKQQAIQSQKHQLHQQQA